MVANLAEVFLAQPVERGAVHLRRPADEVMHLRLEGLAIRVVPGLRRNVAVVDEHVLSEPVLGLPREPASALQQEDPLAGGREAVDEGAAAGAATDHDHVVGVAH